MFLRKNLYSLKRFDTEVLTVQNVQKRKQTNENEQSTSSSILKNNDWVTTTTVYAILSINSHETHCIFTLSNFCEKCFARLVIKCLVF